MCSRNQRTCETKFEIKLESNSWTKLIKDLKKLLSKNFEQSKCKKNKTDEIFNSEESERKEKTTKENHMKHFVSNPNRANLFAASDRRNQRSLNAHGHY